MSKRNFILLIIVLVIVIVALFGFLYFHQKGAGTSTDGSGGTNFISQFNPFGTTTNNPPTTTPPTDVSGYQPNPDQEANNVVLKKVSTMPVAGFTVYPKERLKDVPVITPTPAPVDSSAPAPENTTATGTKKTITPTKPVPPPTEFAPSLRYVAIATGNIYETFADKIEERKFSSTVIPKIAEAFFGNNGESVLMRYVKSDGKTIETFLGNLPKEILGEDTTDSNEVKGTFLPENIEDLSLSSDNSNIFYLFDTGDGIVGTTMNLATSKKVQIFDSPFTEWLSVWPNSKIITLTTKAAGIFPGYMYALDPNSKNMTKVLGSMNGLTTLISPDGKSVLYGDSSVSLNVYHMDTKASNVLGVKTLPEKCVWGNASDVVYCTVPKSIPSGSYPETWYQGEVSFDDQIWKIDVVSGNTTLIADPGVISGEEIDGIKLMLDKDENYLFFVNKKDSFLWELKLR